MSHLSVAPKTLVLHIGPHKTGSTYLQDRLLANRDRLLSHGWDYPQFGIRQFGHHRICQWLLGNAEAAGDVTETGFTEMLAASPRVILSSEDFVFLRADRLRYLKTLLPGRDVRIAYFLRSPVNLWPSHWQELVRHGRDHTLLEYLATYVGFTRLFELGGMNPFAHFTKYAEVFGRSSLRLVCYDNVVQDGGDIFDVFWTHVLGLTGAAPPGTSRIIHPSQPIHMIEMLRSLNQLYRERTGNSPAQRINFAYQKQRQTIEATSAYEAFKAAFLRSASELRLSGSQETIRNQERRLLNHFGAQIINKAADDRLIKNEIGEREIPYAQRFWTDRSGMAAYVDTTLSRLDVA